MEGVTILETNTYTIPLWFVVLVLTIITGLVGVALVVSWITVRNTSLHIPETIHYILSALTVCMFAALMILWESTTNTNARVNTEYTVSVDGSVDFAEFKEKYTIIAEHDDGTFTVKERID